MADKPESDPFLAGIDARITALQQFRESYLLARAAGLLGPAPDLSSLPQGPIAVTGTPTAASTGPIDLPTGVFRDKGLADAVRLFLSIAKRKQPFRDIANALKEGGLATTASDFEKTLSGTLARMKKQGELLQFKEGWDLAASYPESLRQRMAAQGETAQKGKKKAKPKKKPVAASTGTKPKAKAAPVATATSQPASEPVLRAV